MALEQLGAVQTESGKSDEGSVAYLQANSIRQSLAESTPLSRADKIGLIAGHIRAAESAIRDRPAEAGKHLDAASELLESIPNKLEDFEETKGRIKFELLRVDSLAHKVRIARLRGQLAQQTIDALMKTGDYAAAVEQTDALLAKLAVSTTEDREEHGGVEQTDALTTNAPPDVIFQAATNYSAAIDAVAKDETLPPAERDKLSTQYVERAIAALRRIAKSKYLDNPQHQKKLDSDPAFASLRARPEFQKFDETRREEPNPPVPLGLNLPFPFPGPAMPAPAEMDLQTRGSLKRLLKAGPAMSFTPQNWADIGEAYYERIKTTNTSRFTRKSTGIYGHIFALAEHREGYEVLRPRLWEMLEKAPGHLLLADIGLHAALSPIEDADYQQRAAKCRSGDSTSRSHHAPACSIAAATMIRRKGCSTTWTTRSTAASSPRPSRPNLVNRNPQKSTTKRPPGGSTRLSKLPRSHPD